MIKAVFLDFYGTVVHEDGEVIKKITDIIFETGNVADKSTIGTFWWKEFQDLCSNSFGDMFETQKVLEFKSLERTLKEFLSTADPKELSEYLFEHWVKPPIFDDSYLFFESCPLPVYIVSNIDTSDIMQAITYHKLRPNGVFTSEDARAYKPRRELFDLALQRTGFNADEVVHIGDSVNSDVKGAGQLGIHTIWLNRSYREVPDGIIAVNNLTEIFRTNLF